MPDKKMEQIVLKPGPRKGPQNEQEQALADEFLRLLTKKRSDDYRRESKDYDLEQMPLMPQPPPGFRNPTLGPPTVEGYQDPWQTLRTIVPELEGLVPRIRYGPTRAGIEGSLEDLGNISSLKGTNVLGMFDLTPQERRQISLQPGIGPGTAQDTLSHELVHAMDYGHGKTIDNIEQLSRAAYDGPPKFGPEYTMDDALERLRRVVGKGTTVKVEK